MYMFCLEILKDRALFWHKGQLVCVGFPADEPNLCFWLEGFEAEAVGAINNYCPRSLIEKLAAASTQSNWQKMSFAFLKQFDEELLCTSTPVKRYARHTALETHIEVFVWAETKTHTGMKMVRITNAETGVTGWVNPFDNLKFDID